MNKRNLCLGVAVTLAGAGGCVTLPAPGVAPRPAVSIAASFDKTWASALEQLADQGITVRSVDRDAGFIGTESIALPPSSRTPGKWADCGTFASFRYAPTVVDYTLFVRGNPTESSLRTYARYRTQTAAGDIPTECVSTGAFERSFGAAAKERAESSR